MPRKVVVNRWTAELPFDAEQAKEDDDDNGPKCLELAEAVELGETHPMNLNFDKHGIHTFSPSPTPDAINMTPSDKIRWMAHYADGSVFKQYDEERNARSCETMSRENLRGFSLVSKAGKILFHQDLVPGMRFFYRRRTAMEQGTGVKVVHIVGYDIGFGVLLWPIRNITFVYEDEFKVISGDFDNSLNPCKRHPWRHNIKPVEADEIVIT